MKCLRFFAAVFAVLSFAACSPKGQAVLTDLPAGSQASFVQAADGTWGLSFSGGGAVTVSQSYPVQIEVYRSDDDIRQYRSGYMKLSRKGRGYVGRATIGIEGASFDVKDVWTVSDGIPTVSREVRVNGTVADAGFASAFRLVTDAKADWDHVSFLAPGLLYGDPTYDGPTSPGGTRFAEAHRFTMREDFLPSPMYGTLMPDGYTMTILNAAPDATTTLKETQTGLEANVMIDPKIAVGSFGSNDSPLGGVEVGYTFPCSTGSFPRVMRMPQGQQAPAARPQGQAAPAAGQAPAGMPMMMQQQSQMVWARRYNPVQDGYKHAYKLALRFAAGETFPQMTINSYRWAWTVLKPQVFWHDIELVRTCLSDQLSSLVTTFDDRTGLPYQVKTKSGEVWVREGDPAFYWRAPMGFVGKGIESAYQLLLEGYRDPSARGQKMREQGLAMIGTYLKYVPMDKPVCTGVNLMDGSYSMTNPPIWYIREATDDMRMLLEAYHREKEIGVDHPDWVQWCKDFADWALTLQRPDGSLPRSFMINTQNVVEESGTTSYNICTLFVQLSDILGDNKYLDAAIKAGDYVWESYGKRGIFIGGAIDNPNITDKEAGLLSCEAFMFIYEKTKDPKWLERAKTAADFAETWTWIWNVPMPDDAPEEDLNWKHGVPTVGIQGITAQVAGHTDQFLDMSIPAYMKLYKYTGDRHYFDFARILMHNCKAMVALPGRLYGMVAPGYQTENFRMGADRQGRGFGTPEKWMPWVTTNHLYGINAAEYLDKELFDELCAK